MAVWYGTAIRSAKAGPTGVAATVGRPYTFATPARVHGERRDAGCAAEGAARHNANCESAVGRPGAGRGRWAGARRGSAGGAGLAARSVDGRANRQLRGG